jgi:1-acyl-sn-glycerol-3-phosphate acyltransferase
MTNRGVMQGTTGDMRKGSDFWTTVQDFVVTVLLWMYYILGFLLFFSPFYLYALFSSGKETDFQKWNYRLHRSFFALLRILVPKVKWHISDEVLALRSSVIVANHLSFLDPILFVSLFERQKTIVKSDYFRYPVFGWILKRSGYVPSFAEGLFSASMIDQIKAMREFLAAGGNLFIFPEGTRSRSGRIGPFDKGAFKIAKLCQAPHIRVVLISNTQKLFPPDRFLFNTHDATLIKVELAGSIEPDYGSEAFSLTAMTDEARALMERKAAS